MWTKGRQNSGYLKFTFFQCKYFDCHLLKYPEESEIKEHVDEVDGRNHYRINVILRPADMGGEFKCEKTILNWQRLKIFRPDLYKHSLTKVEVGCRYVLSIGFTTRSVIEGK